MVTPLVEFYKQMPEGVRNYFCDKRLFPSMDFLKRGSGKRTRFKYHKSRLRERFTSDSEEYEMGLEYLARFYGIGEN